MKAERKIGLDAVRCFAISLIALFHYMVRFSTNTLATHFENGAWGCVGTSIFFIVSGIVLRMHYKGNFKISTFYKKRWLSIFPLFYFGYILFYVIYAIMNKNLFWAGSPWKLLFTLFGVDNYAKFFIEPTYAIIGEWFTAVIVLLYILYPLLTKCIEKFPELTTVVLTGAYFINLRYTLVPGLVDDVNPITSLWLFYMGMLLTDVIPAIDKMKSFYLLPLAVLAGILTFVPLPFNELLWQNLLALVFVVIIYKVFNEIQSKSLKNSFIYFTKNSYAIYLFHHVIIDMFLKEFKDKLNTHIKIILGFVFIYAVIIAVSVLLRYICDKIMQTKLFKNLT